MPATGARNDPYSAFNFIVEIDGVIVGGFAEAGGLTAETDIIEYRNGDEDITVRKLPGKAKYPNITLKRGFTDSRELWEWRRRVIEGRTERRSGSIQLLDEARRPALTWNFREGWPSKWEGPALNAKNNDVAIENLEIAHEGLELA
ncbi:phage tail protein [Streptomyces sp. YC504]|uniref:Phage tail protein n=1 Tax=Streptomyces mesophilus TaxID=1775132 RepID=A0A6G4XFJ7_9ACTN|nr:phage tail protein [Streptomyces mesophilus]NGO75952.1 phage tail protein [Streptomyces mesophilus]